MTYNKESCIFWVSKGLKCIAFYMIQGYQKIDVKTEEQMWKLIHELIETGYRVQ